MLDMEIVNQKVAALEAYEVLQCEQINDICTKGTLLRHKKTGARVVLMENDDNNKVFNIAFRTPPTDSCGTPHIIEHTVLCGSKNFPLKDPFVELVKGSLNTFLNAITYPDKTMYPVASCNDQDFQNLMHVYLDAVFYPNIYAHEEIFRQEGWNYQLESEDGKLSYNGVVYNEMKGVFSSADDLVEREIFNSLFPDTPYGKESGGDPKVIPELTYEQFLAFHGKYYHPANSYILLYGDMDMAEKLDWIDKTYLSSFDALEVDSAIPEQKAFEQPVEMTISYPVLDEDPLEQNTYLTCNYVVGNTGDVELNVAMQILDYVLLSAPGAPLKQRLLDEGIGKDVSGSYEDGILQPFYSIMIKNAESSDRERFLNVLREELERIAKEGISRKAIASGINFYEFRFREADFASYPKGLIYGMDLFSSWLYDDEAPFDYVKQLDIYAKLREKADEGYFEELIRKYFLNNTHCSILTAVPKRGMAAEEEQALENKLQAYKDSLSEAEIRELVERTAALKDYQDAEEDPTTLECIPLLKRSDISPKAQKLYNTEMKVGDTTLLWHDVQTNGIAYLQLMFDTKTVPDELISYMGLLKSVLGMIGTENYTYGELFHEINAASGGISYGINIYDDQTDPYGCRRMFGIKAKGLYPQMGFVFSMIREILLTSDFTDTKRLREILAEVKVRAQSSMPSAGHQTAVLRGSSYFSAASGFQDRIAGVGYAHFIRDLEENFDERMDETICALQKLARLIFRPENLFVSLTCTKEGLEGMEAEIEKLQKELFTVDVETGSYEWKALQKNEAFKTAGQVQYVACCGNFKNAGLSYTGALRILRVIMGYDYLWMNIRVRGGAYGCMNSYRRNGDTYLVSYRDPNLKKTVEVYEKAAEYIRTFEADERTMDKYVIGAISDMDVPMTPNTRGTISLSAYFARLTEEDLQRERDQVLGADVEDIRALAEILEAVYRQGNICVVGSEKAIEADRDLFKTVLNLM